MEWINEASTTEEMLLDLEGFMRPEIFEGQIVAVETTAGIEYFPREMVDSLHIDDYKEVCDGVPITLDVVTGFVGRMSAPGGIDCTEFLFGATYAELVENMYEMWG